MTNEIDSILQDLNSDNATAHGPTSQRRLLITTGVVAATTTLLTVGALAFWGVTALVDPQPAAAVTANGGLSYMAAAPSTAVPTEVPASAESAIVTAGADMPVYNADTDISTIPLPTNQSDSEVENAKVWLTQQGIIADCMRDQGFDYTFTPWYLYPKDYFPEGPSVTPGTPAWVALDGAPDRRSVTDRKSVV